MFATPAHAATDTVPFNAFGYRDTIYERGPNAAFSVFIPVTHGLRSVHLHAPLTISPQVDRRSTIVVTANDVPVASIAVQTAGFHPTLDVAIPVPNNAKSLNVAIMGHLFELGDICADPRFDDLWFTVSNGSRLIVDTNDAASSDQVGDFLNQYGGTFNVVNKAGGDAARTATIQLAYRLHQIERWRRVAVQFGGPAPADARRIVVGTFPQDVAVHGNELDVTTNGVALIDDRIDRMLIAPKISDSTYSPKPETSRELTLDDLGVATRTLRGSGELPFDIPVTYGAFGGVPQHLRLHVDVAHTPVHQADRAYVQVLVNNTLIGSYDMTGKNVENFDVPLDVDALSSSNVVRVVPTFFYERDGCRGNYPSFTASLLGDTNFQWDGIVRRRLSVGEFFRAASGKIAVLVDSSSNDGGAFALVSSLGTVNTTIRSIDVKPFDGTIPGGYDYAIVVGSGDKVAALNPPMQINGQDFSIFGEDGKTLRFKADYSQPFGVLETAQSGTTPTLIATYWKDASTLENLGRVQPDDLTAQTDNIFVFNSRQATYTNTVQERKEEGEQLSLSTPIIIALFFILLLVIAFFASRRKV